MTSRDFCFWLQGHFELGPNDKAPPALTAEQTLKIQRHLNLVFKHDIDPSMPDPTGESQAIHDGSKLPKPQVPFQGPGQEVARC